MSVSATRLALRAGSVVAFALLLPAAAHASSAGGVALSAQAPQPAQRAANEASAPDGSGATASEPTAAEADASAPPSPPAAPAGVPETTTAQPAAAQPAAAGVAPDAGAAHPAAAPHASAASSAPSLAEGSEPSPGAGTQIAAVADTPPQTQAPAPPATTRPVVNTAAAAADPSVSAQPGNAASPAPDGASSAPPSVTASPAASMPARQVQAVAAGASWAQPGAGGQKQAGALLGPDISALIAQFVSSAGQNPAVSAFALSPQTAGDATQELASVLPQLAGARVTGPPDGATPAARSGAGSGAPTRAVILRRLAPDASLLFGVTAQPEQAVGAVAAAPADSYAATGAAPTARDHDAPVVGAAATVKSAPTFPASRPAARGAIGTGGGSGAPPAAALFALAVICLPMLIAGRIGLDPLRCKSALLTSRLERPG